MKIFYPDCVIAERNPVGHLVAVEMGLGDETISIRAAAMLPDAKFIAPDGLLLTTLDQLPTKVREQPRILRYASKGAILDWKAIR